MYESFYGLDRRPFGSAPDRDFYVPVEATQKTIQDVARCLRAGEGMAILTAPAGLGKSLVCRLLAVEICESLATIIIPSANFPTRRSMLQAILFELDRPYRQMDEQELRLELTTAVRDYTREFEAVAIIFDEAHLLSARLLEEIRAMTNLVDEGTPLVRVALCGQLSLEDRLAEPDLAAFSQRIGCQVVLSPLSQRESAEYLRQRLEVAGGSIELFTPDALQIICQASDGSPRCLNQLADHSLMLGCLANERSVSSARVREALNDLQQLPLHWNVSTAVLEPIEQLNVDAKRIRERNTGAPTAAVIDDLRSGSLEVRSTEFETMEIETTGAIAAFEFGGGDAELSTAVPSPIDRLRSIPRPTAGSVSSAAGTTSKGHADRFEEERVIDPYAKLDAGSSQKVRRNPLQSIIAMPISGSSSKQPKSAKVDHSHNPASHPTAAELDERIEGLILLIDDALDEPNVDAVKCPPAVGRRSSDPLDIAVLVDADPVLGIRVKSSGSLPGSQAIIDENASVKRSAFDVVLPEKDERSFSATSSRIDERSSLDEEHDDETAGSCRPYEQLFSELRRRKGA